MMVKIVGVRKSLIQQIFAKFPTVIKSIFVYKSQDQRVVPIRNGCDSIRGANDAKKSPSSSYQSLGQIRIILDHAQSLVFCSKSLKTSQVFYSVSVRGLWVGVVSEPRPVRSVRILPGDISGEFLFTGVIEVVDQNLVAQIS